MGASGLSVIFEIVGLDETTQRLEGTQLFCCRTVGRVESQIGGPWHRIMLGPRAAAVKWERPEKMVNWRSRERVLRRARPDTLEGAEKLGLMTSETGSLTWFA